MINEQRPKSAVGGRPIYTREEWQAQQDKVALNNFMVRLKSIDPNLGLATVTDEVIGNPVDSNN